MKKETPTVERFIGSLGVGKDQAERARSLASRLECSDRQLRELAHEAHERGILICADNAGYYLPARRTEVDETVSRLLSQANEMIERARHLDDLASSRWPRDGEKPQRSLWHVLDGEAPR